MINDISVQTIKFIFSMIQIKKINTHVIKVAR